jgi:hypothetical protein
MPTSKDRFDVPLRTTRRLRRFAHASGLRTVQGKRLSPSRRQPPFGDFIGEPESPSVGVPGNILGEQSRGGFRSVPGFYPDGNPAPLNISVRVKVPRAIRKLNDLSLVSV